MALLARLKGQRPVKLWLGADLILVTTLRGLDPAGAQGLPAAVRYVGPVWQGDIPRPSSAVQGHPLVLA